MLKNPADRRTVLWVLMAPIFVALQYASPELIPYLSPVSCYLALACGVIAHNHNHCQTFKSKAANRWFGIWLSFFYGYPTFAWVPTHNLNHHKFVNREGDATITWRFTNSHNALVAATYFFVSSYYQSKPINDYIAHAKAKNPTLYRQILTQYAAWIGVNAGMYLLAASLYGWRHGLYVFGLSMGLPAFFALWTIMLFNYDQHVHTNPFSEYDHSRSFTSTTVNFLLFNNGYHLAHHDNPGVHWSKLPEVHRQVAHLVHPSLNQKSLAWYWFKQYALAPFFPSLGTVQIGPGPMNPPRAVETSSLQADPAE